MKMLLVCASVPVLIALAILAESALFIISKTGRLW